MKIVLDVIGDNPRNNDIIVYKNGNWVVMHKDVFLKDIIASIEEKNLQVNKDIADVNKSIEEIKQDIVSLAKIIKEK